MKKHCALRNCFMMILPCFFCLCLGIISPSHESFAQEGNCCWTPALIIPGGDLEGKITDVSESGQTIKIHTNKGEEISLIYSEESKSQQGEAGISAQETKTERGSQKETKHTVTKGDEVVVRKVKEGGNYYLEKK